MSKIDTQRERYLELSQEMQRRGLLGREGPVRYILWSEHQITKSEPGKPGRRAPEMHLVPLAAAEPEKIQAAQELALNWDWGPGRPPKITLEKAVDE